MKVIRKKTFNYDAAATSPGVFDYYVDNGNLSEEEAKHSSPATKVPTYGGSQDSSFRVSFLNARTDRQESVRVDFYANGFNYNIPEIVDPSAFHTWFKIYHNPKGINVHVYDENELEIFSGKEYVLAEDTTTPTTLTFSFGGDGHFFDASIEYLSGNNSGYWIGPSRIGLVDNNTDYWSPADREIAIPDLGDQQVWANTAQVIKDYKVYDENGEVLASVPELYAVPDKFHVMVYPRDFTGVQVRRAKVNLEFYSLYSDDFAAYADPSISLDQKLKKNKKNFWFIITQPGKPIVLDITADSAFDKNGLSYLVNDAGEPYNLIGKSIEINSIYPSYRENKEDYQYIGLKSVTNAPIKSIKICNESREEITNVALAAVFDTSTNTVFSSFEPSKNDVECNFYVRLKKYQITNADAANDLLNTPLTYYVVVTLDNGTYTQYEIEIVQYGYIHSDSMKCYDYYPNPRTALEYDYSTPAQKVVTMAHDEDGIVYPIFWTE